MAESGSNVACYHPISAYQTADGSIVFSELKRFDIRRTLSLPCGQCVGCRLEKSRQWATRCIHEASLHQENAFVTLTYDDAHLPDNDSLFYPDFQKFMKRLRKHFNPKTVRFYMCGEYGENFSRPHYHACLFGLDFPDKIHHSTTSAGCNIYSSDLLDSLWGKGFTSIGDVTFESAAYVARYILKKINGELADAHYEKTNPDTGEVVRRVSEFTSMSLKPGVGAGWFGKWEADVYPHDYCIVRGRKVRPPRYYDQILSRTRPDQLESIKFARECRGREQADENTDERLNVRELVANARLNQFPRKLK